MKHPNTMMGDEEDGTLEVGLLSSASEVSRNPLLILRGFFFPFMMSSSCSVLKSAI